jgi:hypothetical protein
MVNKLVFLDNYYTDRYTRGILLLYTQAITYGQSLKYSELRHETVCCSWL